MSRARQLDLFFAKTLKHNRNPEIFIRGGVGNSRLVFRIETFGVVIGLNLWWLQLPLFYRFAVFCLMMPRQCAKLL